MAHLPLNEIHQLVLMAQEGREEAFARLYAATSDAQYFTALSMLKQPSLAEDAVQIIYMKVYQNLHSLTLPDYFLSWLSRITYNTCVNILESRWRRNSELNDEVLKEVPDSHDEVNPLGSVISQENRRYLLALLNELSLEHRTILVMRYFQELKVREIAEIMELSEGTVKSRIHYGLKKLRQSLRKNGIRSADTLLGAGVFLRHSLRKSPKNSIMAQLRSRASDCLKITGTCTAVGFLAFGAATWIPDSGPKDISVSKTQEFAHPQTAIKIKAELHGNTMRVYLSDDLSGINYGKLKIYSDGAALPLTRVEEEHSFIEFSYQEDKDCRLFAEDLEGNSKTFVLNTIDQVEK